MDRREFLKFAALSAAALTLPDIAIASLENKHYLLFKDYVLETSRGTIPTIFIDIDGVDGLHRIICQPMSVEDFTEHKTDGYFSYTSTFITTGRPPEIQGKIVRVYADDALVDGWQEIDLERLPIAA